MPGRATRSREREVPVGEHFQRLVEGSSISSARHAAQDESAANVLRFEIGGPPFLIPARPCLTESQLETILRLDDNSYWC